MKTHKDLDIWKLGIELVIEIYKLTKNFPKDELLALLLKLEDQQYRFPPISLKVQQGNLKKNISNLPILA